MKKVLSVLLTFLICLSLFACSSNDTENNEVTTSEPEVQEVVEEETKQDSSEVVTQEETTVVEEESKEVDVTSLYYWVNFLNKDGSVIQRTAVKYGETPEYKGETPTYQDYSHYYSFREWDKKISPVYMTQTYIALYDVIGDIISNSNPSGGNNNSGVNYSKCLTFTANTAGSTVTPKFAEGTWAYSYDGGSTWTNGTNNGSTTLTLANANDKVILKGKDCRTATGNSDTVKFTMSGSISASGDVTSLLNGDSNCPGGDIATPTFFCQGMFANCTSLTTAPNLPSTTLAVNCYKDMFSGCTSLTTAPSIKTNELPQACCYCMFSGCTSLHITIDSTVAQNAKSSGKIFEGYITGPIEAVQYMFGPQYGGTQRDSSIIGHDDVCYSPKYETPKLAAGRTFYWYIP